MEYNFRDIEPKWQAKWTESGLHNSHTDPSKPKFYVLDMFPYPSGAGLHVGHPLGYIATDIVGRYKRLRGYNVLRPMGFDAYGLPAEQYAIQTGQHPAITTERNIKKYREQLDKIGFCYDWEREVQTCDPDYYHWTQWAFVKMFHHFYNTEQDKARPIDELISHFAEKGSAGLPAREARHEAFTAAEWKAMDEATREDILQEYRLAYRADTMVNWCPKLGTVLANDEVVDGLSIRGGYPVEQKRMKQWSLRISDYAHRLLEGLDRKGWDEIHWPEPLKEIQRNWIGRSEGAEMQFPVEGSAQQIPIFTTRPDTIYGVTFMVLAPESELVEELTSPVQREAVEAYLEETRKRTERERMADTKKVTGVETGSYAINPLSQERIPIWISDYVLAGYGTGAIMAVPGHDSRDFRFARTMGLPIRQVICPKGEKPSDTDQWEDAIDSKDGICVNSGLIDGMEVAEGIRTINEHIEREGLGKAKVNFRLRDAIFSRQRYWGEPFPVYYENGIPRTIPEEELPLKLPEVDAYLPTETGEPPLGRAKNWVYKDGQPLELSTMPGFAGSSAYYLRYMDPKNRQELVSEEANAYWEQVDLYIGGREHATGHLIYARFWNKFLYDIGKVVKDEPFRKLINQGMIQGRSNFVYRIKNTNTFVSHELKDQYEVSPLHVDVNIVHNDLLDKEAFRKWNPEYANAEFIPAEGDYVCGWAVEKMSKSMFNVVNPDTIIEQYGADTLRMYEMFLGPLEQSKPWDTNGIDGVFKFLLKFWRLFHDENNQLKVNDEDPTNEEWKTLHKTIKKVQEDIEQYSFNTSVSAFMICVNELQDQKCSKRKILEPLTVLLSPFAPHICAEIWDQLGHSEALLEAQWPELKEEYLVESKFTYPVSFNGKTRFMLELPADLPKEEIEKAALADNRAEKWLQGKAPRKVIVVPKRIVNIVV